MAVIRVALFPSVVACRFRLSAKALSILWYAQTIWAKRRDKRGSVIIQLAYNSPGEQNGWRNKQKERALCAQLRCCSLQRGPYLCAIPSNNRKGATFWKPHVTGRSDLRRKLCLAFHKPSCTYGNSVTSWSQLRSFSVRWNSLGHRRADLGTPYTRI